MDKAEDNWIKGKQYGGTINPGWVPPKLDVIDPCSFQGQDVPERSWLVDGWIPMRTVSILGGDGGTGRPGLTNCSR